MKILEVGSHTNIFNVATGKANGISMPTVYVIISPLFVCQILLPFFYTLKLMLNCKCSQSLYSSHFGGHLRKWIASKHLTAFTVVPRVDLSCKELSGLSEDFSLYCAGNETP